jgi:Domain of unknown function (DUF4149)
VNSLVSKLRLVLLAAWLGVAVFFGAGVAPTLFGVVRGAGLANANALAGAMVSRLLGIINIGGFEVALFALVTALFMNRNQNRIRRLAEMISLAIMAIMTAVGHWVIAARMLALKAAMTLPIDQVAADDSRRIAFDNLHRYSVLLLSVGMFAAVAAIIFAKVFHKPSTAKPSP